MPAPAPREGGWRGIFDTAETPAIRLLAPDHEMHAGPCQKQGNSAGTHHDRRDLVIAYTHSWADRLTCWKRMPTLPNEFNEADASTRDRQSFWMGWTL